MANDHDPLLSAFDFDVVQAAFRKLVGELNLPEETWPGHVRQLFADLTDHLPDNTVVKRVIGHEQRK